MHKTPSATAPSRRRKKTGQQVDYLIDLYERLGGKWDGKVRKEAMQATGLSRIQIYKWFFDRKLQEKSKKKKRSSTRSDSFDCSSSVLDSDMSDADEE